MLNQHFNKLDKINYVAAIIILLCTVVYAAKSAEQTIISDDYTFVPVILFVMYIVLAYIFFTIVKCNNLFELNMGFISLILLTTVIPILGQTYDSTGSTVSYYNTLIYIVKFGGIYIICFKSIQFFKSRKNK